MPAFSSATFQVTISTRDYPAKWTAVMAQLDAWFAGSADNNAGKLLGGTWAIPGTIGSTTPNSGSFTALAASGNAAISGSASVALRLTAGTVTDGAGGGAGLYSLTVDAQSVARGAIIKNSAGAAGDPTVVLWNPATSGDNVLASFATEGGGGTARGSIDFNRGGSAVRYNTTSDLRLKTKNGPPQYDPSWIGSVAASAIWNVTWNETGYVVDTFVAQDLYEVEPDAVKQGDEGELQYDEEGKLTSELWAVDPSKLVAKLILEVAALRERLDQIDP